MSEAPPQARRRLTRAIVPALAAAALAGLATLLVVGRNGSPPPGCLLDAGRLQAFGGPVDLVGADGAAVTQADFAGAPSLVYFGFTHCPDVCPTTMYAVGEALRSLGAAGARVQPVLVSVDPARDTPETLAAYVETAGFPARLVGLTGSEAQVEAAAKAFKVYFHANQADEFGAYNVDHSSLLYLMDGDWRARAVMPTASATPQEIAACVSRALSGADA